MGESCGELSRFNGANAFQRWIQRRVLLPRSCLRHAAMGPTPFGIGYEIDLTGMRFAILGLQWGQHLSMLDTTQYMERRDYIHNNLQWGQRLSALDTYRVAEVFNTDNGLQWSQRLSALDTRIAEYKVEVGQVALQWGQRLSALDTCSKLDRHGVIDPLQWGQRLSALDTRHNSRGRDRLPDAAMGPTLLSVGYKIDPTNQGRNQPMAAMGPTPFSVGYKKSTRQ